KKKKKLFTWLLLSIISLIFLAISFPLSLLHALSKHSTGLILLYNLLCIIVNCLASSIGSTVNNLIRFRFLGRIDGGGGSGLFGTSTKSLNVETCGFSS